MYKYADTTPFSRRFNHEETPWSRQPHHFNVCRVIVQLFRWCCWIQLSNSLPKSWLHTKPRVCGECLVLHKTPQLEHREWHHGYSLELQREPTLIFRMWLLSVLTQARDNYLYILTFKVKVTVYVKNTNLRYVPRYVVNHTIDCCAALAGDSSDPMGRLVMDDVRKYTNFNHPCPLSVGFNN